MRQIYLLTFVCLSVYLYVCLSLSVCLPVFQFASISTHYISELECLCQPVAKRHHMVSGSLALLLCCFEVAEGSRAAAPRGDEVL